MNAATQIDEDSGIASDKINRERMMETERQTEKKPRSQKK